MTPIPLLVVVLASTATAGDVPRSGYFGAGVNLEPLSLGPVQAFSGGRVAVGISLQAALQVDLGSRWAFRLPLEAGVGGSGDSTFSELGVTEQRVGEAVLVGVGEGDVQPLDGGELLPLKH